MSCEVVEDLQYTVTDFSPAILDCLQSCLSNLPGDFVEKQCMLVFQEVYPFSSATDVIALNEGNDPRTDHQIGTVPLLCDPVLEDQ